MSSFEHFSHEHPLIFNKERDIEEEINRDHFCHICSLPILLSSFYSCNVTGCKYFLHEPCALLPRQIRNPWYSGGHLDLVKHNKTCDCTRCDRKCKNLHYCDRYGNYDSLHPMCGTPVEIKSKHKSHPLHPLVAVCRETFARCDACGQEQNGQFFSCQPCNFWIHVGCAVLPRFVKCTIHSHPLILNYSINREYTIRCMICGEKEYGSVTYLCGDCRMYAHLSCVADNMEDLGTETKVEIIDLPFDDLDALWSWTIQNLQKLDLDEGNSTYDHNQLHDHGLILYIDDDHGINGKNSSSVEPYISQELVCCNVCIQPIYPPFYACPQSDECHFHLHQQCSELPSNVEKPIVSLYRQELRTWSTHEESLCSLFCCFLCGLPSNGLSYYDDSYIKDIACFSAPKFIKHESHRQHVLYQLDFRSYRDRTLNCCPVLDVRFWNAYYCVDCDLLIHIHCALLPKRVKHKFDIHPLNLITTSIIKDTTNSSENLCEFCEEDIDTRFWYYGCEECNNLFHIKCIPSVGYLSRVKFGNSITVPCHPHRVTFVRMLGYGSQKCGYCKEIIQGFVDDMAFHCSECDFWMHFGCAEECTGTTKFKMGERTIR